MRGERVIGRGVRQRKSGPLIEAYRELAERFPAGLADVDPLPEKSQEKSQEAHTYEDENFGTPSQPSTQTQPAARRWLFVTVIALCLVPSSTRAQGIGDLLVATSYDHNTLQGPIGDALSEMRKVSAEVNKFPPEDHLALAVSTRRDPLSVQAGALHGPDVSD